MAETSPSYISSNASAQRLRQAGLRPTRQRIAIANLLLGGAPRHISAEQLRDELLSDGQPMALATIYNCLHQFAEGGLLRPVHHVGDAVLYDTNLSDHFHFIDVETGELMDIEPSNFCLPELPEPPEGYEAESIELSVRLRRKR